MGWSSDEPVIKKKGMETSTKVLLAIIACIIFLIIITILLIMNIEQTSFKISVDGKETVVTNKGKLITTINDTTYINIEEFSKLVGYEYHFGEEYKSYKRDENKCYVQGLNETVSFYADENRICKLPINEIEGYYREFTTEDIIEKKEEKMYASLDTISLAFNVVIDTDSNNFKVYTLDQMAKLYDEKVKQWGYTSILEQSFENQKSLLYGYLIVQKEKGLYKIINDTNTKEIISDKYKSIEFSEHTKEFFVTNNLGQIGIINLDGTIKIEPIYDDISVLDKESDLYLVQKGEKYGVVKSGNTSIIYPEYDIIGLDIENDVFDIENKYLMLDTLIPVCKDDKWGAFDKNGNMIYKLEYDAFGFEEEYVEINEIEKEVIPLLYIEKCNGIVVKKDEKYGLMDITGRELVPIQVESIYEVDSEEDLKYFMIYNEQELNVIERLTIAGLIKDESKKEDTTNTIENNIIIIDSIENASSNISNTSNITNIAD